MNKHASLLKVALMLLCGAVCAHAQDTILIRNGTVVPVVGSTIPNGSLLIQKGKIAQVGVGVKAPADAKVIDATGLYVYPGLLASFTAIGLTGYPGSRSDTDEIGVSVPQMDPSDAINPEDDTIEVARVDGVTSVVTVAGSANVINGRGVLINLEGDLAPDLVAKRNVVQVFNVGARAQGKYPSTLPGIRSLIRDKLNAARLYAEQKTDTRRIDLEMEALVPVLKREIPALFVTNDEVTVRNALEVIKEYNLVGVLYATADVVKFADELAAEKIPVIWAGTNTVPGVNEAYDVNFRTASVLSSKGVLLALESGGRRPGSRGVRNLPVPAAISVAHGLSEEEALKAITINPARILGVDDQVGSLEVGKTANVVIWSGSPVQLRSKVQIVIIKGKVIPMTSYQTRLRDKFATQVKERLGSKK